MPVSTVEEREKAKAKPIDGPYKEFAEEIRRLLGYEGDRPFLTARMADMKTGVNYSTISGMVRGRRGSPESISKFAKAMNGDEHKLLALAGHLVDIYPDKMTEDIITDPPYDPSREIVGFIDPEDFYIAAQDNGMSPSDARRLLERLEEIRKEKARRQGREE